MKKFFRFREYHVSYEVYFLIPMIISLLFFGEKVKDRMGYMFLAFLGGYVITFLFRAWMTLLGGVFEKERKSTIWKDIWKDTKEEYQIITYFYGFALNLLIGAMLFEIVKNQGIKGIGEIILILSGTILVTATLFQITSRIEPLKKFLHPFYKKSCKECGHTFSLWQDIFRTQTAKARYATCKKCKTENLCGFDGVIYIEEKGAA